MAELFGFEIKRKTTQKHKQQTKPWKTCEKKMRNHKKTIQNI